MIDLAHFIDSDDAFSVLLAKQDWHSFIAGAIKDRPHPPLYGMLLYLIAQLHLDIVICARIFGAMTSCAGFLLLTRMAWQQTNARMLSATVLLVFGMSSYFLYRSLTIRPYAIIIGLGCVQLYCFLAMLIHAGPGKNKISSANPALGWWLLSSVLLASAQYLSVPVTGTQCLLLLACLQRAALKRSILILSVAALAMLYWFYLGTVNAPSLAQTWWVTTPPGARELLYTLLTFFGAAPVSALWLAGVLALIYGNALRHWRALLASDWALAAVALVPVLAVFFVSVLGPLNLFAQRQLIVPALALVVLTCTLTRFLPRTLQTACLLLIIAWAASSLPMGLPRFSKPPFEAMSTVLTAHHVQQVYTSSWELSGLSYYAGSRFKVADLSLAAFPAAMSPWINSGYVCRPEKCVAVTNAIRDSSVHMCRQSLSWHMLNYRLVDQVLFFLPQTLLEPDETCVEPDI